MNNAYPREGLDLCASLVVEPMRKGDGTLWLVCDIRNISEEQLQFISGGLLGGLTISAVDDEEREIPLSPSWRRHNFGDSSGVGFHGVSRIPPGASIRHEISLDDAFEGRINTGAVLRVVWKPDDLPNSTIFIGRGIVATVRLDDSTLRSGPDPEGLHEPPPSPQAADEGRHTEHKNSSDENLHHEDLAAESDATGWCSTLAWIGFPVLAVTILASWMAVLKYKESAAR